MARLGVQVTINVRVDRYSWAVMGNHGQSRAVIGRGATLALKSRLRYYFPFLPPPLPAPEIFGLNGFSGAQGITGGSSLPI